MSISRRWMIGTEGPDQPVEMAEEIKQLRKELAYVREVTTIR